MKKLMFYCQHILGIGHLIRSMEIVRGLQTDFQVYFINGGEIIDGFQVPEGISIINMPGIKTDAKFRELRPVDETLGLELVQEIRKHQLITCLEMYQPDVLMVELFPFGRRRFSFELIPLLEAAKAQQVKVICSLRDIVVTKQDQARHEAKICRLINQYFDQLLIHGDPHLHCLEESFSRVADLDCEVHYTGYVAQPIEDRPLLSSDQQALGRAEPMIVASVGGGRFGHDLLEAVVEAADILLDQIPHHIHLFTGPFAPDDLFQDLTQQQSPNLTVRRYTPNLLAYMQKADLSISMSGYNTTMNILATGVKALMLPFTGNDDQEQTMRVRRLDQLGLAHRLTPSDINPQSLAERVKWALQQSKYPMQFDLNGVNNTARLVRSLVNQDTSVIAV